MILKKKTKGPKDFDSPKKKTKKKGPKDFDSQIIIKKKNKVPNDFIFIYERLLATKATDIYVIENKHFWSLRLTLSLAWFVLNHK